MFSLTGRQCETCETERQALKNGPENCRIRAFLRLFPSFSTAQNEISLRQKAFFLPQGRKRLAAKRRKPPLKRGKIQASADFFFSIRTARAYSIYLTDCKHIPLRRRHARQRRAHDLPRFRPKRKRNPRFRRHTASRRLARYARISGPPVLGGGIRDSRPLRPDVLTACSKDARGRS